ncbi:MAG: phosphonate ABC transporter, permease protein PhnE [Limimaricola sp.]|uniref:phosphonate ABC transporter, permease protein PhnE n=1 Tax=Limimaricola sp. TaxID=2211665 RepID=UPI001D708E5C|nr:phosphonate ABC transporter, permease protein PhnE [Limimaricola sp.]MBI1415931.1 phosphonate ABC transporter, permease protein PhnE [Limimaricola sp.]
MTTMIAGPDLTRRVEGMFRRKRMVAIAVPLVILAYFVYIFFAFDIAGLGQRLRMDNALTLIRDSYSYKTVVTRNNRSGATDVAIEGSRRGTYPADAPPDWVKPGADSTVIDMGKGEVITLLPDNKVTFEIPSYGTITAQLVGGHVTSDLKEPLPDWISASSTRLAITTDTGRLTLTRSKTEVFRYFFGWEMFWFTVDSPYFGHSLISLLTGPQVDPARSNLQGMWQDFWHNPIWRHADTAWALSETLMMAFLGTCGAALVALPVAFIAARNFTPSMTARFGVRRVLDFLRGVDALIWTIVLARAFGPGPMTGALAILVTDTGTFGKIFSEALENVDDKQIEGIRATGAKPVQRYRFGVIPQITPVLLSQLLYFLESNTRSATIIGAITGGGIGLLLTQAMQTQKDWEQVTFYIVLIILMVMLMDWISGKLRDRLIRGGAGGH